MINEKAISHLLSKKETRLALCERDLIAFWVYYFLPSVRSPLAWFHYVMCDDMMSPENCLFDMFRESWKTFWAKVKFIHNIVYKKKRFMMYYCADKRKASSHMFDISVMLTTNKKIKEDFGMILSKKKVTYEEEDEMPTKKTVSEFITRNYVRCKAMSIGESPRGEQYMTQDGTFRPDFAIIDDADILKNVRNKEIITKNEEWFNDELMGGLSDDSQIIFLGNTILKDWLVPRVRIAHQNDPDWRIRRIPLVTPSGKITWPERYNWDDIEKKKRKLGPTAFNRSMLLIPGTPGELIIKRWWIKWTTNKPEWRAFITIWVDPAHSTKTKSDELGITVTANIKIEWFIYRYILESFWLRWDEKHELYSIPFIVWLYKRWKASLIRIETNNGWEIIGRSLEGQHCAVEFITQVKDKETRLLEYQVDFSLSRVFFVELWWENQKLVDQLCEFPSVPNDDRVDSMVNSFTDDIPNTSIFIA